MSRKRVQEAILSAELFWFGGTLGPPKIYDAGTSYSFPPNLRHSDDGGRTGDEEASVTPQGEAKTGRFVTVTVRGGHWTVEFDPAE